MSGLGGVDALICNAGYLGKVVQSRSFRKYDLKDYEVTWNTNFTGNAILCKSVADKMVETNTQGNIVAISSICGQQKKMQYTPYGMSKQAIYRYIDMLQKEYPSITMGTVFPGSVATKMNACGIGDNISKGCNKLNHVALPEEIAALVAFLCSENGRYFKGSGITASACEIF
jgi:NAD(P)-dependent dehydrogenase (short-subunit alcohol dehydrogenase family)